LSGTAKRRGPDHQRVGQNRAKTRKLTSQFGIRGTLKTRTGCQRSRREKGDREDSTKVGPRNGAGSSKDEGWSQAGGKTPVNGSHRSNGDPSEPKTQRQDFEERASNAMARALKLEGSQAKGIKGPRGRPQRDTPLGGHVTTWGVEVRSQDTNSASQNSTKHKQTERKKRRPEAQRKLKS